MGCTSSRSMDGPSPEMIARNRSIDAQLARDRAELAKEVKLLILGTGESGKSTVMKQMTIMHCGGFDDEDRFAFIEVIYSNTVQSMQAVLEALPLLSVQLLPENEEAGYMVEDADADERSTDPALLKALQALYVDPAVQLALRVKSRFQINDSAEYYFASLNRTFKNDYIPTDDDLIHARVRTTGIVEKVFNVGKQRYRIFDVGGQRSERKKWVHCFEGVNVLLFLVAISEYDQMLYEDETRSRMSEALSVFESVSNSRWFATSTLILFLNKMDLFRAKLSTSSLRAAFPNYQGEDENVDQASAFLLHQFKQLYRQPKQIYHHYTTATDTNGLQVVMSAVQDTILHQMLSASGILE